MAKRPFSLRPVSLNVERSTLAEMPLASDLKLLQATQEGIAQLDAGLGVPHSEMMRRTQTIIYNAKAKQSV